MKYILTVLFVTFFSMSMLAQKDNFFVDVSPRPGFSVTYNNRYTKNFGLGIAVQGYDLSLSKRNDETFMPAIIGDVRFYRPQKRKHYFFYMIDFGVNFYTYSNVYTSFTVITAPNNGLFLGGGVGYFWPLTKLGWGPYASLKLISNNYKTDEYYLPTSQHSKVFNTDATIVLSIGFKF